MRSFPRPPPRPGHSQQSLSATSKPWTKCTRWKNFSEIWGVSDLDVLPALALRPQVEVGAILLGAFAEGRMVGFVFGFPGILNGETIIHSDMLGVTSEYRSQSVGYLLKCAQREAALAIGVKRITWTFDPLQSRNAHLNFGKLGVDRGSLSRQLLR